MPYSRTSGKRDERSVGSVLKRIGNEVDLIVRLFETDVLQYRTSGDSRVRFLFDGAVTR